MNNIHPLVSIVIVTYNSESTVIETLDSAANQTYDNIEIIISDDCSSDNTVSVVQKWLTLHNENLQCNIKLLTAKHNQGICKNFNKAIREASGSFIKIIAGDDKLLPNCCTDFVKYINTNPSANFVTSFVRIYNKTFDEENFQNSNHSSIVPTIFNESSDVQLKKMAYSIFVSAPTMFFSRELYDRVGGFDERYFYEDHPFYMNILESGEKIHFCPKETVGYRIHQSTFNSDLKLFNYQFSRSSKQFRQDRCFKYYGFRQKIAVKLYYGILTTFERLHLNKKTKVLSVLYRVLIGLIWKIGK